MDEELVRQTQLKSDEELYEMLYYHREDWMPEALEAAEQEWQSRNLDGDKLKEIQAVAAENERERAAIAEEPLSHAEKIVFFVFNFAFCLGIVQAIIADTIFKNRGYDRKFRDCFKWMAYGFVFYGVIFGACHWVSIFFCPIGGLN